MSHGWKNQVQHTATHYNTLQHTATHCNTLQHTAIISRLWMSRVYTDESRRTDLDKGHCIGYVAWVKESSATHCNTLQDTATHCNTLQHTARHCNTRLSYCKTLQHAATHVYHTAEHGNTLQHTATHCNTLPSCRTYEWVRSIQMSHVAQI